MAMGQDRLSKEEATERLDQRVHVITSTQELCHSTRNFVKLAGDYLGEGSPVCISMESWPLHINRFDRQYEKAFARDPLFGAYLMDRIHKRVQVFLHSCNTTSIEEVESVALEVFRGLQKRVEKGKWLNSMPVWVEWPAPREEGRRKSEVNGIGARQGGRGVVEGKVYNHGVDPQVQISENLGIMTQAARTEILRLLVGADGMEICLRYSSKGEYNRSCTRSHASLRGHMMELVIRFIRGSREAMNKNKRKFDGVGEQVSHRGHWDRGGYWNSENQNGARFGYGRGRRGGGRYGHNGGGGVRRGGKGSKTNPPHQYRQKTRGGGQNGRKGGRSA